MENNAYSIYLAILEELNKDLGNQDSDINQLENKGTESEVEESLVFIPKEEVINLEESDEEPIILDLEDEEPIILDLEDE